MKKKLNVFLNKHEKLNFTALNDDRSLYYDNFIPFCLSLKQTDYQDEVGVIDYGMSELKKDSLHRQGIKIFPASNRVSELSLDRHLSAADIAKKYDYNNVAVYDADIWFPSPHLSLFKTIENSTALFAAQDICVLFVYFRLCERTKQRRNNQ